MGNEVVLKTYAGNLGCDSYLYSCGLTSIIAVWSLRRDQEICDELNQTHLWMIQKELEMINHQEI